MSKNTITVGTCNEYTKTKRQPRDDEEDEFELKLVRVWDYEELDGHGVSTMGVVAKNTKWMWQKTCKTHSPFPLHRIMRVVKCRLMLELLA